MFMSSNLRMPLSAYLMSKVPPLLLAPSSKVRRLESTLLITSPMRSPDLSSNLSATVSFSPVPSTYASNLLRRSVSSPSVRSLNAAARVRLASKFTPSGSGVVSYSVLFNCN